MARQALVVLLLVVFTVVGGASAAIAATGGVTPPRSLSGPESAAAHTPDAPTPARRTDLTARTGPRTTPGGPARPRRPATTAQTFRPFPAPGSPPAISAFSTSSRRPAPAAPCCRGRATSRYRFPLGNRRRTPSPSQPTASAWRSPAYGALRGRTVPSATVLLDRSDGASSPR